MDIYRLKHSLALCMIQGTHRRAEYLRRKNVFAKMGKNCGVMMRLIPLYPKLISIGNNVQLASNVTFITHDISYLVLNRKYETSSFREKVGCIEIGDNCYIGTKVTIMPDVRIGDNTIIGAGSIITKDIEGNGVYVGIPAKKIMDFSEYVEKNRCRSLNMMSIHRIKGNELEKETIETIWEKFFTKRTKMNGGQK